MSHLRSLALVFALGSAAAAQEATQEAAVVGLHARLQPLLRVVMPDKPAELLLSLETTQDVEVDATLLAGVDLVASVGEQAAPPLQKLVPGKVRIAAGTRIDRRLTVDLGRLNLPAKEDALVKVTFRWPGLAGASTVLEVAPDALKVDLDRLDYARTKVLLVTSHGNLTLGFYPDRAPKHVRNFVKLAKTGFYHGTKFHRVIKGFMIQGGCPNTREGASGAPGTGDPGYHVDAEFNDTRHVKGILSMARARDPNSAGCQFFICHGDASQLDKQYTAFGVLESGMDTLDRIADVPVEFNAMGEASVPATPVILYAAIVLPSYGK